MLQHVAEQHRVEELALELTQSWPSSKSPMITPLDPLLGRLHNLGIDLDSHDAAALALRASLTVPDAHPASRTRLLKPTIRSRHEWASFCSSGSIVVW